jgi:hypothetical protein
MVFDLAEIESSDGSRNVILSEKGNVSHNVLQKVIHLMMVILILMAEKKSLHNL